MSSEFRKNWTCVLPDLKIGGVQIQTFEVSRQGAFMSTLGGSYILPGVYKKLILNGALVMSDTPKEFRDHFEFLRRATGNVLINGLGMGCCLNVVLNKPEVKKITVIEKDKGLIDVVSPYFKDVEIINADAFEWTPSKRVRYDAVWHDIWNDICVDNLPAMHRLHRKYGRRADWQGSWSRKECEWHRDQDKRYG